MPWLQAKIESKFEAKLEAVEQSSADRLHAVQERIGMEVEALDRRHIDSLEGMSRTEGSITEGVHHQLQALRTES